MFKHYVYSENDDVETHACCHMGTVLRKHVVESALEIVVIISPLTTPSRTNLQTAGDCVLAPLR